MRKPRSTLISHLSSFYSLPNLYNYIILPLCFFASLVATKRVTELCEELETGDCEPLNLRDCGPLTVSGDKQSRGE
jgi:hypothetical protein